MVLQGSSGFTIKTHLTLQVKQSTWYSSARNEGDDGRYCSLCLFLFWFS